MGFRSAMKRSQCSSRRCSSAAARHCPRSSPQAVTTRVASRPARRTRRLSRPHSSGIRRNGASRRRAAVRRAHIGPRDALVAARRCKRQRVLLLLQSANRDEREFTAPDRFSIHRSFLVNSDSATVCTSASVPTPRGSRRHRAASRVPAPLPPSTVPIVPRQRDHRPNSKSAGRACGRRARVKRSPSPRTTQVLLVATD